ncbi:hypothetical protein D3878_19185 [Noviherbaspirillum sedimenti]|uniref:Uncharacterized protein n=1 Tax=Noviherbaspirillum sedimenti TaxID=2320865 RepID=A0A3A3GMD1_9BURK|nr:hypothetical protein D3878_19185 [Noviherbaspirillum sedimenti]
MEIWFALIVLSAMAGVACAGILRGRIGLVCSGAVPWVGLLGWLLYNEYFVPYRGGGASMWPVAQLFAGSVAALVGVVSYKVFKRLLKEGA